MSVSDGLDVLGDSVGAFSGNICAIGGDFAVLLGVVATVCALGDDVGAFD
jgi:hypothetical protein